MLTWVTRPTSRRSESGLKCSCWRSRALAQQYIILFVRLSDQYLADHFQLADPEQRPAYLAALTTAGYLYWFVSSYTILVSVGATALVVRFVAQRLGAARHATAQSLLLAAAFGLAGTGAGLLGLPALIEALELQGNAAEFCYTFLEPLAILLLFQIVESACIACLAGAGDTITGLIVLGSVAVLNVPLAWLLSFGIGPWDGLGFVGIALGTGLSHVAGCLTLLAILAHGRSGLKLQVAELIPDVALLRRLPARQRPGRDRQSLGSGLPALVPESGQSPGGPRRRPRTASRFSGKRLGYLAGGASGPRP